jgi:ABC-2 type transport system permease protein
MSFSMRNRMRTKAFITSTIVIVILTSVVVNLAYLIFMDPYSEPDRIGFVENDAPAVTDRLKAYYGSREKPLIELVGYPDAGSPEANEASMKERIRNGEIEGYLDFEADGLFPKVTYKSDDPLDTGRTASLESALQAIKADIILSDANLTDEQREALAQRVRIEAVQISTTEGAGSVGEDGKSQAEQTLAFMLVYVVIFMLYMGILITGQLIATEITAEKSSRVMEILVTSVAPLTQMFGKIFGMCVVGLSQIAAFGLAAAVNLMLPHSREMLRELGLGASSLDPMLIVYAVVFYLTGYFLYATLYAAAGSIVSRTEELGQAIMPLTTMMMVALFVGVFGMFNPNAGFSVVLSYVPFFTPYLMFARIGMADPALWEVLLSLGILVAAIFLLGWLSAKIYRTGVLMYGKRPSWKELRKAMKAYKV